MAQNPSIVATLAAMPLFAGLADDDLDDIARSLEVRQVKAGKTLIKQGQWGHELLGTIEYSQIHALIDTIPTLGDRLDALTRDRAPE